MVGNNFQKVIEKKYKNLAYHLSITEFCSLSCSNVHETIFYIVFANDMLSSSLSLVNFQGASKLCQNFVEEAHHKKAFVY